MVLGVQDRLSEQAGFVHPETKRTEGILGIHVDDGLGCGSKYFSQKLSEI